MASAISSSVNMISGSLRIYLTMVHCLMRHVEENAAHLARLDRADWADWYGAGDKVRLLRDIKKGSTLDAK